MHFTLIDAGILIAVLAFSISVHESFHAYAADQLGDPTARALGRLSLNPLVHIDPLMTVILPLLLILSGSPVVFAMAKPVPFNLFALRNQRWGPALVALAGPFSNFFLAFVFSLPANLLAHLEPRTVGLYIISHFCLLAVYLNVALGVINLIPIPPFDGSKLLYALLPSELALRMMSYEQLGLVFFILFIMFFSQEVFLVISRILTFLLSPQALSRLLVL